MDKATSVSYTFSRSRLCLLAGLLALAAAVGLGIGIALGIAPSYTGADSRSGSTLAEIEIEPERMFWEHLIKGMNQGMEDVERRVLYNELLIKRQQLVDALLIDVMEQRARHRLEEDSQSSHQSRYLDWRTAGALYWRMQLARRIAHRTSSAYESALKELPAGDLSWPALRSVVGQELWDSAEAFLSDRTRRR